MQGGVVALSLYLHLNINQIAGCDGYDISSAQIVLADHFTGFLSIVRVVRIIRPGNEVDRLPKGKYP